MTVIEVLKMALDWEQDYRAINHLGKRGPHWVNLAREALCRCDTPECELCGPRIAERVSDGGSR